MNRTAREAAAWDRIYAEGTRRRASPYYVVSAETTRRWRRLITAGCAGQRVLDLGCGEGTNAVEVARRGAIVTGIDVSTEAIRGARQRAGDNLPITFLRMSAESMSFPDDSFDLVYGNAILHHLDLRRALPEIARVLRPGGRAVFHEPLGHNLLINLYRRMTPRMRTPDERPLRMADLDLIGRHFAELRVHYSVLVALAATPFRALPGFGRLLGLLHAVDRALFRLPLLRRQAWQVVIDARR